VQKISFCIDLESLGFCGGELGGLLVPRASAFWIRAHVGGTKHGGIVGLVDRSMSVLTTWGNDVFRPLSDEEREPLYLRRVK